MKRPVGNVPAAASGWVLPALLREHSLYTTSCLNGRQSIEFRDVWEAAATGDACACAVQEHCLRIWGEALVSFIHLFDPERIIVGGGVMNDAELVLVSFRKTVAELAWAEPNQVEIVEAQHPNNAGLIGAAALFCETGELAQQAMDGARYA